MGIRLIGILKDINNRIIGCRLLDMTNNSIEDIHIDNIIKTLITKDLTIEGLGVENGELVGTNGSISRYPVIFDGGIREESPLIVLAQYIKGEETVGFKICDRKGKIIDASKELSIWCAERYGIANGAIKSLGDKKIISPIKGTYRKIPLKGNKLKGNGEQEKGRYGSENTGYHISSSRRVAVYGGKHDIKLLIKGKDGLGTKLVGIDNKHILDDVSILVITPQADVVDNKTINNMRNLQEIVVQEGVEVLKGENCCVEYSYSVESIRLPSTLKKIDNVFFRMRGVKALNIKGTSLEKCTNSFHDLGLLTLELPNTIKYIENSFNYMGDLRSVKLPNGLKGIEENSFSNCERLKRVAFGKSLKYIGDRGFRNCCIDSFIITEQFERLGYECFSPNTMLVFEDGITTIKKGILTGKEVRFEEVEYGEPVLMWHRRVRLPDSVNTIEDEAFYWNRNMEYIRIPEGIKHIGDRAFAECGALNNISDTDFGDCTELEYIGTEVFSCCVSLTCMDLSSCNKLKVISDRAFYGCKLLREVKFSQINKIEYIGDKAFENCYLLKNINIGDCKHLQKIGSYAFVGTKIEQAILCEGLIDIGNEAFRVCGELLDVVLPRSLINIGNEAFSIDSDERTIIISEDDTDNIPIIYMGNYSIKTTYFVYEGSIGHLYCISNNLRYLIIDKGISIERNIGNTCDEIDANKYAKELMALLASLDHKGLANKKFIHNAGELVSIYNYLYSLDESGGSIIDLMKPGDRFELLGYTSEIHNKINGVYLPQYIKLKIDREIKNNLEIVKKSNSISVSKNYGHAKNEYGEYRRYNEYKYDWYSEYEMSCVDKMSMVLDLRCKRTSKVVRVETYYDYNKHEDGFYRMEEADKMEEGSKILFLNVGDVSRIGNFRVISVRDNN